MLEKDKGLNNTINTLNNTTLNLIHFNLTNINSLNIPSTPLHPHPILTMGTLLTTLDRKKKNLMIYNLTITSICINKLLVEEIFTILILINSILSTLPTLTTHIMPHLLILIMILITKWKDLILQLLKDFLLTLSMRVPTLILNITNISILRIFTNNNSSSR